jgi:hypothetical protein
VVAVEPGLTGADVVDASGLLVAPGLVDLHTHVLPRFTYWGIDPDPLAARSGVTTWVDAGSAGAFAIDGFREDIAARCAVRVRAFLNISGIGLAAETHELANPAYLDDELCAELAVRHAGFGKRDAPYDIEPPIPLRVVDRALPDGLRVEAMNDQHAFLRFDDGELRVGDLVVCGISHPCTAFDKWSLLPLVDDDDRVIGAIRTLF